MLSEVNRLPSVMHQFGIGEDRLLIGSFVFQKEHGRPRFVFRPRQSTLISYRNCTVSRCADNEIKVPVLIPVYALELDASTTSGFQKIGADERAVL